MDTAVEQRERSLSLNEVWCRWLLLLPPWDRRTVLKHEAEWYEFWASGEWNWTDVSEAIRAARSEPKPCTRCGGSGVEEPAQS